MRHHKRNRHPHGAAAGLSLDEFEAALRGHEAGRREAGRRDHKTMQLCRQVERAIAMALAGECYDDVLRDLSVDAVEPAGGTGQLVVRLRVPATLELTDVLQRLDQHAAKLRRIVAGAICRKRVPSLIFICLPPVSGQRGSDA